MKKLNTCRRWKKTSKSAESVCSLKVLKPINGTQAEENIDTLLEGDEKLGELNEK